MMTMASNSPATPDLSSTIIPLLRGVIDRAEDPQRWHDLVTLQAHIRDYLAVIGLDLHLVEDEGYAFLRQRIGGSDAPDLPRLVPRRPLTYPVTLLLVALRRRMAEHDANSGDQRLILTRDEIGELVRVFLPDTAAEERFRTRLEQYLSQVERLGFIRGMRGREDTYEFRRILRAYIDAQWLQELTVRLATHRDRSTGSDGADAP